MLIGTLALAVALVSPSTDTWNRAEAEDLFCTWCDALVAKQIVATDDPTQNGALACPACGLLHGRCGDIVWPMARAYVRTGKRAYLQCAELAVAWSEKNLLRKGGFYVNDQQSKWVYTTVFSQISFGRVLFAFRDQLPPETIGQWTRIFRRQSEFLLRHFTTPGHNPNVNYLAAFAEAMGLAWKVTGEERFRVAGLQMIERRVLPLFNDEGFLVGENNPIESVSPTRHLPYIDIAYNLEESLPALASAADFFSHAALAEAVLKSVRVHASFMLSDGGMDATTGSRAIKWTYYGSRTSDGAIPLWAWCAKKGEPWAVRMIDRTLKLLRRCTSSEGLLYGGPDYAAANEPACVHHTFTHVKALAAVLEQSCVETAPACPLPREAVKGSRHLKSMDVDLVSMGPWRATFSANDAPKNDHRRLAMGGGALTFLWHERLGPVVAGTPARFFYAEGHNMQDQRHDFVERCMTPRLECANEQGVFSNLPDRGVHVSSRMENGAFVYVAEGALTAANDLAYLTNGTYRIEWRLFEKGLDVAASASIPCAFVLPIRSSVADRLTVTGDGVLAPKETDRGSVAFSTVGGFLFRYLVQTPALSHRIRLRERK